MFPESTVPLNIFEPRYLQMVNDSMKKHRMIGMIQPKKSGILKKPDLYEIGCAGKITSFNETDDGRILIILNGICRFKVKSEANSEKLYRECDVEYEDFLGDITKKTNEVNFSDLNLILNNMKTFFLEKVNSRLIWLCKSQKTKSIVKLENVLKLMFRKVENILWTLQISNGLFMV